MRDGQDLADHAEVDDPDAVADAHKAPETRVDGDAEAGRRQHDPDEGEEEEAEEGDYRRLPLPQPVADHAHREAAEEASDGAEARHQPSLHVGQPLRLDEELSAPREEDVVEAEERVDEEHRA